MRWACAIALGFAGPAAAQGMQDLPPTGPGPALEVSGLLVIDRARVFAESRLAQGLLAESDADIQALAAENREIEARLREEERLLTARRGEMEPEAFRAEAEAFDARVQGIRDEQGAKQREVEERREAIEPRFWEMALPVVAQVLRERGAVVVLERDGVFFFAASVDITAEVIAGVDAATAAEIPEPAPGATADPETPAPDALVITPPGGEAPAAETDPG